MATEAVRERKMANISELETSIIKGNISKVRALTLSLLNQGFRAKEMMDRAIVPAMDKVGKKFSKGEFFLPELIISAKTMQESLEVLKPYLETPQDKSKSKGKVLFGTVKGDLHDLGKNIAIMMLRGSGFEVKDLGVDVHPERFAEELKKDDFQLCCLSALLSTTMPEFKKTIQAIKTAGLREKLKIMVGGAPVTEKYAIESGADAYGKDAAEAVEKARKLIF